MYETFDKYNIYMNNKFDKNNLMSRVERKGINSRLDFLLFADEKCTY